MTDRRDWLEAEREDHDVVRELQRLKRRAKARPVAFVLLAALLAGAVVYKRASRPEVYKARVVLRVVEGELSEDRTPLPRKELRDYVRAVAYTRARLLDVIEELDLYPMREVRGDNWAIATMRSHLTVDVYRNYFANDRGYETARRSARIAVIFRGNDPDKTVKVARRLADEVARSESQRRQELTAAALDQARRAVARAREQVNARRTLLTETLLARDAADRAHDGAEIARLTGELQRLQASAEGDRDLLRKTEGALSSLELRAALERQNMGLSFEVADETLPEPRPANEWMILAALGVVTFMVLVPLCAIGVAAFDARVHDLEDVERLGLDVVGHIPPFEGDAVGSLRDRGASGNRVT
jgi:hypothetical protein